jgi:hypothetical protein
MSNPAINGQLRLSPAVFLVRKILHLGIMLNNDDELGFPEGLDEFLEHLDDSEMADLSGSLDLDPLRFSLECGDEAKVREEFLILCQDRAYFGFLCLVEAPEVTRRGTIREVRYGIRRRRWFYSEDLEGIIEQASAWAMSLERTRP